MQLMIYKFVGRIKYCSVFMKNQKVILSVVFVGMVMSSCSLFKPKYGCPTNGKNVGAEKILSGDPAATKAAKKAKKFKA